MMRATDAAHALVASVLRPGDLAVDATAGNGHDAIFLAECVGPDGRVIAFDRQPSAIERTRALLAEHGCADRVECVVGDHAHLGDVVPAGQCGAVMFNLGYLPGGDHAVTTVARTTLPALDASRACLRAGGLLTVVVYPGHPEGARESTAIAGWIEQLGGRAEVHRGAGPAHAPYLVAVHG